MAYASLTNRILAFIIDIIIAGIIYFVITLVFGVIGGVLASMGDAAALLGSLIGLIGFLLGLVALFGYFIMQEASTGQTIGKKMMKIRVVSENGGKISMGASIIRNLMRLIDNLFIGLVGILVANSSARKQRLGDQVAHTVVVQA